MTYKTQILVIPEDYEGALKLEQNLKKGLQSFKFNTEETRIRERFDLVYDVVLVNYDGVWYLESIRSSEKRLKWKFKEENGFLDQQKGVVNA